ncbi:MAG: SOS response-associated peptidase [Acetobacteraceae bacterium]|nr:SOS response-associated peptidase [Acetobacteraceae bacterium]
MCGRFASFLPAEYMARLFRTENPLPNAAATWNLAPTEQALVVRRHPQTGARHLDLLTWGLLPHFTRDPAGARKPINARAETLATSGMFRDAFAQRRCLVPASAFYEWKRAAQGKHPYAIARRDDEPMALAGLWEGFRAPDGGVVRSFAIVTTDANPELAQLHNRMPVIVRPEDWTVWLGEAPGDVETLLRPAPDGLLRIWPVSRHVNSVQNDGSDLLTPLEEKGREEGSPAELRLDAPRRPC